MLDQYMAKTAKGNSTLSDRVSLLKIAGKPLDCIQIYAPTSTNSNEDIEKIL